MNRIARRSINVKGSNSTEAFYQGQAVASKNIKAMMDVCKREAFSIAVKHTVAAFCIALNAEYDFGAKRINRILDHVNNTFDCIKEDRITLDDLITMCKEFGIEVKSV